MIGTPIASEMAPGGLLDGFRMGAGDQRDQAIKPTMKYHLTAVRMSIYQRQIGVG